MPSYTGFEHTYDNVARKFYFMDSDIQFDGQRPSLSDENKEYLLKASLFADATVLPTTNPSLYTLPMDFPELFYIRANIQTSVPRVSFLFQGDMDDYFGLFKHGIEVQRKKGGYNPALAGYLNANENIIKKHDENIRQYKVHPVKKETPTSLLLKKYIIEDLISDDAKNSTPEDILTYQDSCIVEETLHNNEDISVDTFDFIRAFDKNKRNVSINLKSILHDNFYAANEDCINNNISSRRNTFSETVLSPFCNIVLFNEKTGLKPSDLVQSYSLYDYIRSDNAFQRIREVYFLMIEMASKIPHSNNIEGVDIYNRGIHELVAIYNRNEVNVLIDGAKIYIPHAIKLKIRNLHYKLRQFRHATAIDDNAFRNIAKRTLRCGIHAASQLLNFITETPSPVSVLSRCLNNIVNNAQLFLLERINETYFHSRINLKRFNEDLAELSSNIVQWRKIQHPALWGQHENIVY